MRAESCAADVRPTKVPGLANTEGTCETVTILHLCNDICKKQKELRSRPFD